MKIIDAVRVGCDIVGHRPFKFFCDTTKSEGVYARAASVKLQVQLLGWRPEVSFREGIEKTIEWFANSRDIDALKTNFEARLFERKPRSLKA